MAITYPLSFPAVLRGEGFNLDLQYNNETALVGGGGMISRDLGATIWGVDFQSTKVRLTDYYVLKSWIDLLEGGTQPFYCHDVRRCRPRAYATGMTGLTRAGGGSFDGTCKLSTVAADNKTVTLNTLPASFKFTTGDYFAFDYGGVRALHRVMADATANGSGVVSVEVRPHVRPGWAANATVYLEKPAAKMFLVPDSYKPSETNGLGAIAFRGIQTLKP